MATVIDLRSDTVTLPTPAMREAMARAEVGDDVLGEDPTVRRLEELAAERMGKEAALFCASGTMSNLVALLTHTTGRGEEVIVGSEAHILHHESGAVSSLAGLLVRTVANDEGGGMDPAEVAATLRRGPGLPRTALLCLENTHNRCSGAVLSPAQTAGLARIAHEQGVRVHLDGARIFNAAVALGCDVRELTATVDSVCFCVSKGLSAPVGSLLCGPAEFIQRARLFRRMVGGGMRQAGVIAAAGIVALETMVDRLAEDHENARELAFGLAHIRGFSLNPERVQTNIVIATTAEPATVVQQRLREVGVLVSLMGPQRVRFVTHYGITKADIQEALGRVRGLYG